MTNKRFEASSDTRFLAQAFAKVAKGGSVTYDALSQAIGRDVRKHARASLHSALRISERDGLIFEADPNIGYRRLDDHEIVRTQGAKTFSRIGRCAKRGMRRIGAAKFEALNNDERKSHNAQLSMLGALRQMSTPKSLEKVSDAVAKAGVAELPVGQTLRLFTDNKD